MKEMRRRGFPGSWATRPRVALAFLVVAITSCGCSDSSGSLSRDTAVGSGGALGTGGSGATIGSNDSGAGGTGAGGAIDAAVTEAARDAASTDASGLTCGDATCGPSQICLYPVYGCLGLALPEAGICPDGTIYSDASGGICVQPPLPPSCVSPASGAGSFDCSGQDAGATCRTVNAPIPSGCSRICRANCS
jgi:hypothetical protein